MTNSYFSEVGNVPKGSKQKPRAMKAGRKATVKEKTANWPGLPGKAQPKRRSGGTRKIQAYPASKGL